jgi:hypothetical protein
LAALPAAGQPASPAARWAVAGSSPAAVHAFWTPQRLARVRQAPVPATSGSQAITPQALVAQAQGTPVAIPSTRPAGVHPDSSVWITTGRLVFHNPEDGGDYLCTANVVTSNNHDVIATARHCVMDISTGTWYQNFQFAPDYDNGSAPYGWWAWRSAGVRVDDTSPGGDNAFIVLSTGGNGNAHIQDAIGSSGIGFNFALAGYAWALGIPGDKNYAVWCQGVPASSYNGGVHIPNCWGLDGGSSGGPYIVDYNSADGSAFQTASFFGSWGSSTDGNSYFAYYGNAAEDVYNGAQNA